MVIGGESYPWIPDVPAIIGQHPDDRIDGVLMARRAIKDLFSEPPPEPPYGGSGIYKQSLLPAHQIGEYWYLQSDPDHLYAVPFGATEGMIEAYVKARAADLAAKAT